MHFSHVLIKNKTNQSKKDILPSTSHGDYGAKKEPFHALKRTKSRGRNEPSAEVILQAYSDWCNLSDADGALGDFRSKRTRLPLKLEGGETEEESFLEEVAFEPGLGDEMDEFVHKEDWDDQDKIGSEGRERET